jgi:hypothetical protein
VNIIPQARRWRRNWASSSATCYIGHVTIRARQAAALVLVVGTLGVCASATAGPAPWQSFTDPTYHLRVAIPGAWYTVPPTVAGVEAEVTRLQKRNNAGLAIVYSTFINSAAARKHMLGYHFQAFQYVPGSAIQPDFAIAFSRTTPALAADTQAISKSIASRYEQQYPGAVVTKSAVVTLPAGPAAMLVGTRPVGAGLTAQVQIYVIGQGDLLYEFSFIADKHATAEAATFAAIMHRFAFT